MLEGAITVGQFMGPLGGLLCMAWAMGAISGYVFHGKTVLKMFEQIGQLKDAHCEQQINELKQDVAVLENELGILRSKLGM